MSKGHVEVATTSQGVFCRVVGLALAPTAMVLRQFCQACIAKGHKRVVIDLAYCKVVDSTFMGTLVAISADLGIGEPTATEPAPTEPAPMLVLCNPNERVRQALTDLGVTSLVGCRETAFQFPTDALTPLPENQSVRWRLGVIREAHERLIAISADNERRFGPYMRALAEEAPESESGGGSRDAPGELPAITPAMRSVTPLARGSLPRPADHRPPEGRDGQTGHHRLPPAPIVPPLVSRRVAAVVRRAGKRRP